MMDIAAVSEKRKIIDVKDLRKTFGSLAAVNGVSICVKEGEVFGFLGPNGSGKTTTIRMLCGLMTPDSGTGTCLGFDILKESYQIKTNVGYMTQHFGLYDYLSIYENLEFVARLYQIPNRKQRILDTLDRLHFPEQRYKQLAGNLSGGWKQRLALAAAILHKPKLLLLDEPTAGVDPKARRDFWDEIHTLSTESITTLVSTHYMDEAERCTRLAYLSYGDLLIQGNINEVIAHAHLTTYEVKGENLAGLATELRKIPHIGQVASFGQALHVSSSDGDSLEKLLQPFQKAPWQWKKISSDLEDVFISFMDGEMDGEQR
jgi:ABC-2 type transport system ATP-binding protein